jgi:hypothetical protein
MMPNQSPEPTLASGTAPAVQEPWHIPNHTLVDPPAFGPALWLAWSVPFYLRAYVSLLSRHIAPNGRTERMVSYMALSTSPPLMFTGHRLSSSLSACS